MKRISEGVIPVDVTISIKEENKFGYNNENKEICELIINTIKNIISENNKIFPDIDMSIFEKELQKRLLPKLVIDLVNDELKIKETEYVLNNPITIVTIMSTDRTNFYPDKLYIIRGISQTGEAEYYPCTVLPLGIDDSTSLIIKPGIYEDLFFFR